MQNTVSQQSDTKKAWKRRRVYAKHISSYMQPCNKMDKFIFPTFINLTAKKKAGAQIRVTSKSKDDKHKANACNSTSSRKNCPYETIP